MLRDQLKRKLKDLRQTEIAIRFRNRPAPQNYAGLVWNEFFSLKPRAAGAVRYSLEALEELDHAQLKEIFSDYICFVYFQYCRENGIALESGRGYDPHLLALMGLPPQAGGDEVRKRFRELARKYHPDAGGQSSQFIALMDVYHQLNER
ncbi:MAG: J domain-containing protein [Chloroflexi bacterium]|nr:J domain-containing protein [Chloroflexota bacterium]MCL5273496.1 J domain-containing protein [Chloroflexota bacterium]